MNIYNDINQERGSKGIVRKLLCAAFLISHFSFLISLTSCSDDLIDKPSSEVDEYLLMRGYNEEQIKMQRFGYAYNAAGNVMDDSSFSAKPIINMNLLREAEKKYGIIVSSERRHYTSVDIFSGNTIQELGHEETKYTIGENNLIGGGKFYRKNTTVYSNHWTSCYKAHMFIKHVMASNTIDVGILRCLNLDDLNSKENVLAEDFRKAVADLVKIGEGGIDVTTATKFSEKYGTHIVVSSNLGGMIELQMEINRDSCVDKEYTTTTVAQMILGKEVVKTSVPMYLKPVETKTVVEYQGQINVKGGIDSICSKLHRTFDQKRASVVKIGDGDYYKWATTISIAPESYNATFIGGRYLPLYELFEDANTRRTLRKVYETYLKTEAPTQEIYEPAYGVLPVQGNYGHDVRVASTGTDKAAILCYEYVPSIRSDKPCTVAYPLIRDKYGDSRPYLYAGLFVGDESHRPGRVIWEGSASKYIPNDSIYEKSDTAYIRELFDENTHALKQVYFYWNAVHPQPCPAYKDKTLANYTTTVFKAQPAALQESTTFAKVASTFWSVRPVHLKTDNLQKYWKEDSLFVNGFAGIRNKDYEGVMLNLQPINNIQQNYFYCLLDGGCNILRVEQPTNDSDGNKRWTLAVNQSMAALGLNDYLPDVQQSQSITKMLGNRMSIFYDHSYDGRNRLGLDWPTGYYVISHVTVPSMATTPTQNDSQGMPILTNDVGQARIMRLSGSGTDLLLDYTEYVRAFNYSDQLFFKFFPIYITINKF